MGMGKRNRSKQDSLFIPTASLARSSSHDFYERLNQVLSADGIDDFVEDLCEPFYVQGKGRPRIPPGTYFRMLLVGFFEGQDSERGIDWRVSDSMALRRCLGVCCAPRRICRRWQPTHGRNANCTTDH